MDGLLFEWSAFVASIPERIFRCKPLFGSSFSDIIDIAPRGASRKKRILGRYILLYVYSASLREGNNLGKRTTHPKTD